MSDDIFEPISQGSDRAQDEENSRIEAITNELRRRCKLYEAQFGNSQPHVSHFEVEQRVSESYAKEQDLWLPMERTFGLGTPCHSGSENDTYVSNDIIFKVNNLLNSGSILGLLEKVKMHNIIFPDTFYQFYAFTGFDGRTIMPIIKQDLVKNATPATQIMIDTYMAALGFEKASGVGCFSNGDFLVWDVVPRNVLVDSEGDVFVVDAEIKRI